MISVVDENVFVARGVLPQGALNPVCGPLKGPDGHRPLGVHPAASVTHEDHSTGYLNNRGLIDKRGILRRNLLLNHTRLLLLKTPSRGTSEPRFVTLINALTAVNFRPILAQPLLTAGAR